MSTVVLSMQVSLDGYVAASDGNLDWVFRAFSDELIAANADAISRLDAVLMGRHNYLEQAAAWSGSSGPIADVMNRVEKVVFSRSLRAPLIWQNSRLATHPVEEVIRQLSQRGARTIGVPGGAGFAQHLADRDLIDEYRLAVHPVALGAGSALFRTTTTLLPVDFQEYPHGVVIRRFRPNRHDPGPGTTTE